MGYIAPSTVITFYRDTGLSPDSDNTLYFTTESDKAAYFRTWGATNNRVKTLVNNSYQRENRNFVRVNAGISELYDCDYLSFTNTNYENLYNNDNNVTIKITGIIRAKKDVKISLLASGIAYNSKLAELMIEKNINSEIVKAQEASDNNILTMQPFTDKMEKKNMLRYLGGTKVPVCVLLYPTTFDKKEELVSYLDKYNEGKEENDKVIYTDLSKAITGMTSGIMDAITIVLIAFSAISLIVSTIMIAIITYISVLERTKEIGILRAIGARKKDITRVFNAETFIIGLCSGGLGILIAFLLTIPINKVLKNMTYLENVASLNPIHAVLLVLISVILTLIGGWIPAKMAAKKDPVNALRTE